MPSNFQGHAFFTLLGEGQRSSPAGIGEAVLISGRALRLLMGLEARNKLAVPSLTRPAQNKRSYAVQPSWTTSNIAIQLVSFVLLVPYVVASAPAVAGVAAGS